MNQFKTHRAITTFEYRYIKRLIDIACSFLGLIILSPLLIASAVAIKLTSVGPILYTWNVIGLGGKPIKSWKFRSMVQNADQLKEQLQVQNEMSGPVFKMKNDPRITKIGYFIRKYSIDELPQLFSVLKGDLSLVGPRPPGPHEWIHYLPWQRRKVSVRPGITCIWQISGRNKVSDFEEWVKMDLEYIDNWSLWLDLKILFKTILVVITAKGAY